LLLFVVRFSNALTQSHNIAISLSARVCECVYVYVGVNVCVCVPAVFRTVLTSRWEQLKGVVGDTGLFPVLTPPVDLQFISTYVHAYMRI